MRVLLTLQYWHALRRLAVADQRHGYPTLESALATMFGTSVRIEGAGRTDAGVHARAQRAHFDSPSPSRPADSGVISMTVATRHSRHRSRERRGRLPPPLRSNIQDLRRIWKRGRGCLCRRDPYACPQPLDAGRMRGDAALAGRHDFALFTGWRTSTERTITSIDIVRDGLPSSSRPPPTASCAYGAALPDRDRSRQDGGGGHLDRGSMDGAGLTLWEVRYETG